MERSEALVIAKQAYKEICMTLPKLCMNVDRIYDVRIQCRFPDFIWVEDFEFDTSELHD